MNKLESMMGFKKYLKRKKLESELEKVQKEVSELFFDFVTKTDFLDNSGANTDLTESIRIKSKICDDLKDQIEKLK